MAILSRGCDGELFDGFTMPFKETSKCLEITFLGRIHAWPKSDAIISGQIKAELKAFAKIINFDRNEQ